MSAMTPGTRVTLQAPQGCLTRGTQDLETGMPVDGGFLVVKNGAKGQIVAGSGYAAPVIVQFDDLKGVAVSVPIRWVEEDVAETDRVPCVLCGETRAEHPVEVVAEATASSPYRGRRSCPIWVPEIRE